VRLTNSTSVDTNLGEDRACIGEKRDQFKNGGQLRKEIEHVRT